jgi:hypothetical protein
VDPQQLLTLAVGAFFGAFGWLLVGLYMQRRQHDRESRSAARAVYFEMGMNEIDIRVAAEHGVYQPLRRGSFDRLLPELATWLDAAELETIVAAYMSQAGYEQAQRDEKLPAPVRVALLGRVLAEHRAATLLLRQRAFSTREAARLSAARSVEAGGTGAASADAQSVPGVSADV